MAVISAPLLIQTSWPLLTSVATATKGRSRLSIEILQMLLHASGQPHAAEEAGTANGEIEKAGDAPHGERAGEGLQFVQLAGEITAADESADRGAGDHRDLDAFLVQRPEHADMGPAAGSTAAQRQRDLGFARRGRRGNMGHVVHGRAAGVGCIRRYETTIETPVQHSGPPLPRGIRSEAIRSGASAPSATQ